MTRLTFKEARRLGIKILPGEVENKYKAEKVTVDGHEFPSRKEANKYCELLIEQRAGIVKKIELQPVFILQDGYTDKQGRWVKPIIYWADFGVTYMDGRVQIVDTKGFRTKVYLMKKKMLLAKYPELDFIEE